MEGESAQGNNILDDLYLQAAVIQKSLHKSGQQHISGYDFFGANRIASVKGGHQAREASVLLSGTWRMQALASI